MPPMDWLLVATGFVGALTAAHFYRVLYGWFAPAPSAAVNFSPKGGCTEAVIAELRKARREILVLAYGFTSKPIAQALVEAKQRGVTVEVVLDHSNEKETSELAFLLEQGLSPLIDPHHAIAHNKVMIIDSATVITGSFNFTPHAELENAENLLVLKGQPALVQAYRANFRDHRAHARAPQVDAAAKLARRVA